MPILIIVCLSIYHSNLGWKYITTIKYGECSETNPFGEHVASDKKFFCEAKVMQKRSFLGTVREIKKMFL